MPNAIVKSYAKETGKSVEHVEQWWEEAKKQALKKFKKGDPRFWAYVNAIVERRGKLAHGKKKRKNEGAEMTTFKQFLAEEYGHEQEKSSSGTGT